MTGRVRVGIGGWTFEPWRNNFYPAGLPAAREREYASRRLSMIEVNGTFYSTMSAATFGHVNFECPRERPRRGRGPSLPYARPAMA